MMKTLLLSFSKNFCCLFAKKSPTHDDEEEDAKLKLWEEMEIKNELNKNGAGWKQEMEKLEELKNELEKELSLGIVPRIRAESELGLDDWFKNFKLKNYNSH